MGDALKDRFLCYGYIKDGKKGCRWLDRETSEETCISCSFYRTKQEYIDGQREAETFLYMKRLKVVVKTKPDGENYVTAVNDEDA